MTTRAAVATVASERVARATARHATGRAEAQAAVPGVISRLPHNMLRFSPAGCRCSSSTSRKGAARSSLRQSTIDTGTSGAAMVASSIEFRQATQIKSYVNPSRFPPTKSRVAKREISPVNDFSFTDLIDKATQCLKNLLPSKSAIERVEAKADAAAAFVEQGTKMVQSIADEVEEIANAAEMGAEEVENLATKVGEVTARIQKVVDDAANFAEGEPPSGTTSSGTPSLGQAAQQLKQVAANKKSSSSSPPSSTTPSSTT